MLIVTGSRQLSASQSMATSLKRGSSLKAKYNNRPGGRPLSKAISLSATMDGPIMRSDLRGLLRLFIRRLKLFRKVNIACS